MPIKYVYSSGNTEFDAFTMEYAKKLEDGDKSALKFREMAAADDARTKADNALLKLQGLRAVQNENNAVKKKVATHAPSESGREQARQAEIYREYGDIDAAVANAQLEADMARRQADYLGTTSRAKYADDFDAKSVFDSQNYDTFYNWANRTSEDNYMTDEERGVYNYIYATEGAEAARAFLDSLTDYLNQREGQAKADEVEGKFLGQMGVKAAAGFDQFGSGIASLLNDGQVKAPSAIQYASAAVDEDLAGVDLKWYDFAEGQWKDQKIFGRSLGQVAGDAVQTTANMAPSILASLAVGTVSKSAGAWVGSILMGSSAAGNAYQDMLNQGYSQGNAAAYGVLSGLSEMLLEKMLGGITALGGGGLSKAATGKLAKLDGVLKKFAQSSGGEVLLNAGSEAMEEGLQSILEPYFKSIVTGEDFTVDMEEALYSALMGFVTGGVFEGVPAATKAASDKITSGIEAKKNAKAETPTDAPQQAEPAAGAGVQSEDGKGVPATKTPGAEPATASKAGAANSIKQQLQSSQNELGAMQVVAEIEVPSEFTGMDITGKQNWVVEKLRPTGFKVERKGFGIINFAKKQLKAAFNYFSKGGAEEAVFEAIPHVLENGIEISSHEDHKGRNYQTVTFAAPVTVNGKRGNMAVVVKRTTDNFYKVHRILSPDGAVFELSETTSEAEPTPAGESPVTGSLATPISSASVNSIHRIGGDVNPDTQSGKSTVRISEESSPLKAASKKYGAQATMMEDAYQEGQDVERYDREYKLAYDLGKEGASRELLDDGETLIYLTAEQRDTAYRSGAAAAENAGIVAAAVKSLGITGESANALTQGFNANQITAKDYAMGLQEAYEAGKTGTPLAEAGSHAAKLTDAQRQIAYKQGQKARGKQVAKQQAQARKNRKAEGADTSKGKVHFEGDRSSLNKTQKASLGAMEVLAKTLGMQIHVFESEVDAEGNHVGANGWYDSSDGSIHIDLYAGNSGKGTMLFTVAHELTHFIKQWSPAKFEVLANFLTKQYTAQGQSISELVEAQQDKAARNGRELDYDAAYEEMVADSMESMLSDGSIIEMMAELKQQDQSLWQKICDWFMDLADKLRAVVDAYKGVQPDSTEGRMVADMKDMIGTLEALYMDALVDASENFDGGAEKNTTPEGGTGRECDIKLSSREENAFKQYAKAINSVVNQSISGKGIIDGKTQVKDIMPTGPRITAMVAASSGNAIDISQKQIALSSGEIWHEYKRHTQVAQEVSRDQIAFTKRQFQNAVKCIISPDVVETVFADPNNPTQRQSFAYAKKTDRGHYVVVEAVGGKKNPSIYPVMILQFSKAKWDKMMSQGKTLGEILFENDAKKLQALDIQNNKKSRVTAAQFASYEAIANTLRSPQLNTKVSQPDTEVKKKFSDRDSDGNQLSKEQQEYFKDSKERDNQGRLRVMYRGDSTEVTVFDRKKSSYSNLYGRGFYFTNSASHAGQYGQATAYYLNITNPVSTTDCTITKEQMRKFLEAVAGNEDDYSFENYGYGATIESVLEGLYTGKSDFAMLYDVSQTAIGDMVEAVELFNKINGTNYDGFILDTETVIFNSAQAKRTDNHNPTANPDTRYSQRDVGRQEAVTQALEKENAKLREDVAELREMVKLQRQVTGGTKFTKTSVEAAARYLKQNANAKGDTKGLMKLLNSLYEYIASTKELTWESVKEQAQGAVDWLWEHIDRRGKPTEYAQDILRQLHGSRVRLDESQMAEAAYRFGSYDAFRKGLMGNITLAKNAETSLDSLWAEFSEMYPDVFDGEISAADMPSALMDVIHRLRSPDTTIDYARNREMMEQDLLREIYDSYWRVSTLYTPADVGARRINKLKNEHYQRMDKLKQQHRETIDRLKQEHQARLEQVRKDHRAKLEEKVDLVTKRYQEARKKNVEGRNKTEMRRRIRKKIRELSKLLVHGTKERNVKEGMKDFVSTAIASAEVLFTDEYTNEDMVRNGVACYCEAWESSLLDKTRALIRQRDELLATYPTAKEMDEVVAGDLSGYEQRMKEVRRLERKISENMGKLRDVFVKERARMNEATVSSLLSSLAEEYWKLGTADEEYIRGALDENVHQHLMSLSEEIGGTTVKDMSLSQLEQLHKAYTMVLTTVRNANKSFAENLKGSHMEQAKAVTGELAQAGKKRKKQTKGQIARAKRSWNNLKSVFAFERIGSGTLKQLYENLRGGEDTWMVDMDHARAHFLQAAKDTGYNGWDLNKQTYSFESSTGLEFDLNLGQIMSIYAYARRGEQALDHLMKGGFVFDKYTEERVTEHGIPKTYLKDDATAYNLSLETIQQIIGKLTPEQRAFVEKMQDYLSDTMGAKGNEVSMKLYGVKLFGEKFYFPLRSSEVYSSKAADQEIQKQQGQVSIKNAGFTHSTTPNAANPVVLSGFMDVWANHVNDMSMYHAFVLPMEDFNKVYHYGTPHTEEGQSGAVKQAIINAHGSAATDYINQFIRDLNGGVVADPREGQYKAWISKFKKASVMASASVVIQQPTAIVRALAYIDAKYFGAFSISRGIGRALGNKITGNHTRVYEELKKYAPVAAIKQMGRFDTDMGMGAVDYLTAKEFEGFKEQAKALFTEKGYLGKRMDEVTGFLAERADEITWAQIWQAVKNEVADKQGLKMGSEAHLQAAGKRFTEVITRTQVYDSVFSRSANMRAKNGMMSMVTSFMAEPTTTANMLTDAIRKAKQGDVKHFLRVGASVAGAIIFNNILRSAVYAMRDDDEDETFVEKYLQALTSGVFDDLNPMSYLPFWRDVWSLVQRYDVERADMSVIATLMDAAYSLADVMAKDTSGMTEEELAAHEKKKAQKGWSFADALASAVGLPMKNVRRDILGAVNLVDTLKADGSRKTTSNSLRDKVWEDFVSSVPGAKYVADLDSRTDDLYDAIVAGDNAYMERLKSGYKSEQSYLQAVRKGLRENDGRIRAAAVARIDGDLDTYMTIAKEIIAEGYFTQDDVVVAINGVINELTPSESSSSAEKHKGLFDANAFAVAVSQDDTEMAKIVQADIIRTAQRNGKTEEEAQKSFISSASSACKEMFGEGDLSEEQAVNALMDFCEKDEVEARASVAYWDFTMEYPDAGASAGWFETYCKKVENSGISIEKYVEYRNRKSGYTKREDVLEVIDGMVLTSKQKDALYRAEGYAESTLDEAPWHK